MRALLIGTMLLGVAHAAPPVCDAPDEVRAALAALPSAKSPEQRVELLRALLVKFPDDLVVHEAYAGASAYVDYAATRAEYARRHAQSPGDARWASVHAWLVSFASRKEALELWRSIDTPRAHFRRASLLLDLKDKPAARRELDLYLAACPRALDPWWLNNQLVEKSQRLKESGRLRALLEARAEPQSLHQYSTLWTIESQSTPPALLATWRKQVAKDLARLRQLASTLTPTQLPLRTFEEGYRIVADREGLAWVEAQQPRDANAFWREVEEWTKTHAAPAVKASRADRRAYQAAQFAASAEWVKKYPDVSDAWGFRLQTSPRALPIPEVRAIAAHVLAADDTSSIVAGEYAARGLDPDKVVVMTQRHLAKREKRWANDRAQVDRNAEMLEFFAQQEASERATIWDTLSQAYFDLRDLPRSRDVVSKLKAQLDATKPDDEARASLESMYWLARGRVARLEKRSADALGFFLKAHALEPTLDDWELAGLWKELGGGEEAYALLGGAAGGKIAPASQWKTKDTALPALVLTDLAGKTWRSADWKGKTVLLVMWATWCGPCKEELPHLEKLYQAMKGRTDVVIVSVNMDSQIGLIEPFLKEKQYTFPVLLASDWADKMLGSGIPVTWLADRAFVLRYEKLGYDPTVEWVDDTRATIDQLTKAGAASR